MTLADGFRKRDKTKTLWDRETWEALFGEAVRASQDTADSVALLLKDVVVSVEAGPEEARTLCNTAREGIEWVWPFTVEYELSFKAFLYYIEGITVGGDDPRAVLKEVIARADDHLAEEDKQPPPKESRGNPTRSDSSPKQTGSTKMAGRSKRRSELGREKKNSQGVHRSRRSPHRP